MDDMFFELSAGAPYFYMSESKVCIYADIELDAEIDRAILEKALAMTLKRLPYFALTVTVSEAGDRYILVPNEKPFPIHEKNGFTQFNSESANAYLLSINYYRKHILFEIFHGLSDGMGFITFIKTLIKAYFELKENRRIDCEGIKSVYDVPDEREWHDPLECIRTPEREFRLRKQTFFSFSPEKTDENNVRVYRFSVPETVLVDYAKKYEGGVSGAIALTLARAVDCIEHENTLPVKIDCPIDMRKILGCEQTLRNCTKSACYFHSTALRELSYEKQLSILKGQMMLQSCEEYQLPRFRKTREELDELNTLPSVEAKKKSFSSQKLKSEPIVSYLGRFDMGELNDRIESVAIYGKVAGGAGIQNVCLCFKGRCYMNVSYNLKSEAYIRLFANELRDFSSDCSEIERIEYTAPVREG